MADETSSNSPPTIPGAGVAASSSSPSPPPSSSDKAAKSDVVRAAGFVIFRLMEAPEGEEKKNATRQYLLMHSRSSRNWTPPKGRMDEGEKSLMETALREVEEESGLLPGHYEVIPAFERRLRYVAYGKDKEAVYWLAKLKEPLAAEVRLSEEHTEFRWVGIEEAKRLAERDSMRQLLQDAEDFLLSSST